MWFKDKIDLYIESKIRKILAQSFDENSFNIKKGLQELALQETCVWIQENVPINLVYEDRFDLLSISMKKIEIKDGLILEFGVYKGDTINHISKSLNDKTKIVYGFDSFEGLSEPWIFSDEGGFSEIKGELPVVESNVKLVKGFFNDSLPEFIKNKTDAVCFLHIDSDLYSSAKTILDNLKFQIKTGTVIVFDEFFNYPNWKNGEYKAWNEFVKENHVEFDYLGYTYQRTSSRKSGNQLAVKIKKISNQVV